MESVRRPIEIQFYHNIYHLLARSPRTSFTNFHQNQFDVQAALAQEAGVNISEKLVGRDHSRASLPLPSSSPASILSMHPVPFVAFSPLRIPPILLPSTSPSLPFLALLLPSPSFP